MNVENMLDRHTKILIIMPKYVGLIRSFEKNIKKYFTNAYVVSFEEKFKYPHFGHEIYHAFRKYVFKDRSHKIKLYAEYVKQSYQSIVKEVGGSFDYILVIRPDLYPIEALETFTAIKTKKMVAYQWDGLERFPDIKAYLDSNIFDDFFVFQAKDIKKFPRYDLKFTTNFYFDNDNKQQDITKNKHSKIAYFVGAHQESRYDEIIALAQYLKNINISIDFNISYNKADKGKLYEQYSIKCSKGISYLENLNRAAKADILVDLCVKDVHTGLSLRVFEAMYAQKKLITNNPDIKDYEFYHPNNIFILTDDNMHGLENFLSEPFVPLDKTMLEKYSFANWLRNIFDIVPYQKIPMPKASV